MCFSMARANDFVDPDYDRRLAEFRAEKERMKKEIAETKESKPRRF